MPLPVEPPGGRCPDCRTRRPSFSKARAAGIYAGTARALVRALKFERREPASYPLVDALAAVARREAWDTRADLVAAVPLHPRKRRERGFNQSDVLAHGIARACGLPFLDPLVRTRDTPPQGAATTLSRERNVEGAFALRGRRGSRSARRVAGKRVLLVDDVMTSGATLSECARVLKRAGALEVFALAAARGGVPGPRGTPLEVAPLTRSSGSHRAFRA